MYKRAYKLQEFTAHSQNVNCLKIGRRSAGVLVTGADDKKVNMWAIGKPNSLLTLTGHQAAVECVTFDNAEEIVVAGAANGTLKLWDLEEAKVVRTLTGHRSNVISVDFHPYGEFFASGSLDTNLKVWDIRRKGCIHTYKGHTGGVTVCKFSPDGRWLVSGGQDSTVKLWDLTAGKMIHDFNMHTGPVNDLAFHPQEFVLASASQDRSAKLWDLESFGLIDTTGPEATGIKCVAFTPDGRTLLSAVQDSLKVWSWEPSVCHEMVDVPWSKLADMSQSDNKLIGCSFHQTNVSVWIVDLSRVAPFAVTPSDPPLTTPTKSFLSPPPPTTPTLTPAPTITTTKSPRNRTAAPTFEIPRSRSLGPSPSTANPSYVSLKRSPRGERPQVPHPDVPPPRTTSMSRTRSGDVSGPNLQELGRRAHSHSPVMKLEGKLEQASRTPVRTALFRTEGESDVKVEVLVPKGGPPQRPPPLDPPKKDTEVSVSEVETPQKDGKSDPPQKDGKSTPSPRGGKSSTPPRVEVSSEESTVDKGVLAESPQRETGGARTTVQVPAGGESPVTPLPTRGFRSRAHSPRTDGAPAGNGKPASAALSALSALTKTPPVSSAPQNGAMGLDINAFLPKGGANAFGGANGTPVLSDTEVMDSLLQNSATMSMVMQTRLTNLQIVRTFWAKNDLQGMLDALEKVNEPSALVDVLGTMSERPDTFTLEMCTVLLPLLRTLLVSEHDRYALVGMGLVSVMLKLFGMVVRDSRLRSPAAVGVDLMAEERQARCERCFEAFTSLRPRLELLTKRGGEPAKAARDLLAAVQEVFHVS